MIKVISSKQEHFSYSLMLVADLLDLGDDDLKNETSEDDST